MHAITAVYRNGQLHPTTPITLPEGQEVKLWIVSEPNTPAVGATDEDKAAILRIASMPMESGGRAFDGRDHDRILYGNGATS